jgi:hypothetical protein
LIAFDEHTLLVASLFFFAHFGNHHLEVHIVVLALFSFYKSSIDLIESNGKVGFHVLGYSHLNDTK